MPRTPSWDHTARLVRVFPDREDTIVWFEGPFPYPESCLSAVLIGRMEVWEESYYANLTDNLVWRSVEETERLDAEGVELAFEIGPDFDVEYRSFTGRGGTTQLRGRGPAQNPAAREAFSARAETNRAERAELQAMRSNGAKFRWQG